MAQEGNAAVAEIAETPLEQVAVPYVEIDGEQVYVKRLSLNQTLALSRFLGKVVAEQGPALKASFEASSTAEGESAGGAANYMNVFRSLLESLEEEPICTFFGILMNRPDPWIQEHWHLARFVEFIGLALEVNEPDAIRAAFQQVIARWRSLSQS